METNATKPTYSSNRTERSYIVTYIGKTKEFPFMGNSFSAWKEAEAWMHKLDCTTTLEKLNQGDPFYFDYEDKTIGRYVASKGSTESYCPRMGSDTSAYDKASGQDVYINTAKVIPIDKLTPKYNDQDWIISDYQYHNAFHIFKIEGIKGSIQSCLPQEEAEGIAKLMVSSRNMYEALKKISSNKAGSDPLSLEQRLDQIIEMSKAIIGKIDGK